MAPPLVLCIQRPSWFLGHGTVFGVPRKTRTHRPSSPSTAVSCCQNEFVSYQEPSTSAPALFVVIETYRCHVGLECSLASLPQLVSPQRENCPESLCSQALPSSLKQWNVQRLDWSSRTWHNEIGAAGSCGQQGTLLHVPLLSSQFLPIEMRSSALVLDQTNFKYMLKGEDLSLG